MTMFRYELFLQTSGGGMQMINLLFIAGFIGIFYFFMIRPQQKRQKEQKKFVENLKKGDEVVTTGGAVGKIMSIEDAFVILEVDKGVKMKFEKSSVSFEHTNLLRQQTKTEA